MYDIKKQKLYTKEQKNDLLSSDFLENTEQDSLLQNFNTDKEESLLEDFQEESLDISNKKKLETKEAINKYSARKNYDEEYNQDFASEQENEYEQDEIYSTDTLYESSEYDIYDEKDTTDEISVAEEKTEKQKKSKKEDAPLSCQEFERGDYSWEEFNHKKQEEIVKHYSPKIRFIALRMKGKLPKHIELNELISSGTVGLLEALKKFKPQLGIRFDSYAESRIRGAMIDELRRLDWFPRSLRTKAKDIKQAIWKLEHEIGRTPTTDELAEFTGLPEKEIESTLEAIDGQLCLSLDSIQETMASVNNSGNEENPYQSAAFAELVDKVAGLIDTLTPREKLVLSLYYNDELNMREASEVMEVTEGRVSQLHTQAINKLRKAFAEQYQDSL